MPSDKPLIALRLEQPLYDRVASEAEAQGRTPANFIAQVLRVHLRMTEAHEVGQLDIEDIATKIAAAVKAGPVKRKRSKPTKKK